MINRHHNLPELRGETTHLERCGGWLSIARYQASVNLITTPSFELSNLLPLRVDRVVANGNTFTVPNSQNAILYGPLEVEAGGSVEIEAGGSLEIRTDCEQNTSAAYAGAYGVEIVIQDGYAGVTDEPRNGVYVEVVLDADNYVMSAYVKLGTGMHRITIRNAGNAVLAAQSVTASASWQRIILRFTAPSTATYRVFVEADDSSTSALLTDAWMMDAGSVVTTYGDGSYPGWSWDSTPHDSTSTRSSGPGGELVSLHSLRFLLTALTGHLGAPIETTTVAYGQLAGSRHARDRVTSRPLTILGRVQGHTLLHLQQQRAAFWELFNPHRTRVPGGTTLRYASDGDNEQLLEIDVLYLRGLTGQTDNNYGENIALQFQAISPYWRDIKQQVLVLNIGSNIIAYNGTAQCPIRIVIMGVGGVTSILNGTTGKALTFASLALTSGDRYELDTELLTATLNGSDARDTVDASSDFLDFGLVPGDNMLTLTADAGVSVILLWTERYVSAWKGEV